MNGIFVPVWPLLPFLFLGCSLDWIQESLCLVSPLSLNLGSLGSEFRKVLPSISLNLIFCRVCFVFYVLVPLCDPSGG